MSIVRVEVKLLRSDLFVGNVLDLKTLLMMRSLDVCLLLASGDRNPRHLLLVRDPIAH